MTPRIPTSLLSLWNPKIYSTVSGNWGTVWRGEGKFQLSACSQARNLCLLSKSVFPWLSPAWPRHSGPHPFLLTRFASLGWDLYYLILLVISGLDACPYVVKKLREIVQLAESHRAWSTKARLGTQVFCFKIQGCSPNTRHPPSAVAQTAWLRKPHQTTLSLSELLSGVH